MYGSSACSLVAVGVSVPSCSSACALLIDSSSSSTTTSALSLLLSSSESSSSSSHHKSTFTLSLSSSSTFMFTYTLSTSMVTSIVESSSPFDDFSLFALDTRMIFLSFVMRFFFLPSMRSFPLLINVAEAIAAFGFAISSPPRLGRPSTFFANKARLSLFFAFPSLKYKPKPPNIALTPPPPALMDLFSPDTISDRSIVVLFFFRFSSSIRSCSVKSPLAMRSVSITFTRSGSFNP
mmetsp:Transcript_604/g.2204  ORF Transcript_604/g.2204 Transcript_604/m.2204 type:complete len:236 (-) Transcript_604:387-1094(-)